MILRPQDTNSTVRGRRTLLLIALAAVLLLTTLVASAASPLSVAGYLGHSYAGPPANSIADPTAKGGESKLWWHGGYWWGVLFSPGEAALTIHRLDQTTHTWIDSGVVVDDRITSPAAQADVLWDEAGGYLFIATHREQTSAVSVADSDDWARLLTYHYDQAATTWTLESGYPVTINTDITETLVLDKDSSGRLWVTYVSRVGSGPRQVYVNASAPNNPQTWGTPFVLPFAQATVSSDDISALVAFADSGGPKIGVMWSNQLDDNFYMALRPDSAGAATAGWVLDTALNDAIDVEADDHIKLAEAPGGVVLAAVKTSANASGHPLIAVVRRAADGVYSLHPVANYSTKDTRPTLLVDTGNNQVHLFSVSEEGGGNVCIQSAPLATVAFHPDTYNCSPPPPESGVPQEILGPDAINAVDAPIFIGDHTTYVTINNPTTTKQMATAETGIAVLASDNVEKVYVHNVVGGAPPPPPDACGDPYTPIYTIQGSGSASPLAGTIVSTEGVVVGDFQAGDGDPFNTDLGGFFVQDPAGDGDPTTSDGLFVFAPGSVDVTVGDRVRVRGSIEEFSGMTRLSSVTKLLACSSGHTIAPASITLPVASQSELERYEGMLVTFPQALVITGYDNFARLGEILLAAGRQFQPTAIHEPDSAAAVALAASNAVQRIILDDGRSQEYPDPARHPNGLAFTLDNRFRGGDTLVQVTGVIHVSSDLYRIQPTAGAVYTPVNSRPAAPEDVGGDITVAAFNVDNYFLTLDLGPDVCGPGQNMECLGADTAAEFERQRAKILSALAAIGASVVGLVELENTPGVEPLADIVAGLNAMMGASTYAYVETGVIGPSAIRVGIIYRPAMVTLVGDPAVLNDQAFVNPLGSPEDRNRPALGASFVDKTNGGVFTVAVSHLKSRQSECPEEGAASPLQGNCNLVRALGAEALVDWLATDPTGSGSDNNLIIGDLNSYDKEDPIDVVKLGPDDAAGTGDDYVDLLYQYVGEYAYTYVFDGQLGYLDYAMANIPLLPHVTGATAWHINADEPDILDYDMTFKQDPQDALFEPNAYRSSDHDPVIVGLAVCETVAPSLGVTVSPERLWPPNNQMVTVQASITVADNFDTSPQVTVLSVISSDPGGNEDIVIVDDDTFQLRAERVGRTYTITYRATDACGNMTTVAVTVTVGPSVVLYLPIIAKP